MPTPWFCDTAYLTESLIHLHHVETKVSSFLLCHQRTLCRARANCGGCWTHPWWRAPLSSRATTTVCLHTPCMAIPSTRSPCTSWTAALPLRSYNYLKAARHPAPPASRSLPTFFPSACLPRCCCSCFYYCCCCCLLTADRAGSTTQECFN